MLCVGRCGAFFIFFSLDALNQEKQLYNYLYDRLNPYLCKAISLESVKSRVFTFNTRLSLWNTVTLRCFNNLNAF